MHKTNIYRLGSILKNQLYLLYDGLPSVDYIDMDSVASAVDMARGTSTGD